MKYYLLQTKLNGIKNIDKEILIKYHNSVLSKKIDISKNHVKAIYGTNGAGKTAIVYAMEIYNNIVTDSDYLTLSNANGILKELINKNTKEFFIENIFAELKDENTINSVYKHGICVSWVNNRYELTKEYFELLTGKNINTDDNYRLLFKVENGKLVDYHKKMEKVDYVKEYTQNLLSMQSFCITLLKNSAIESTGDFFISHLMNLFGLCLSMVVVLQYTDRPFVDLQVITSMLNQIKKSKAENDDEIFSELLYRKKILNINNKRVKKNNYREYLNKIKNMESFIKVFKNDLDYIDTKEYEDGDEYECETIMVYSDGKRINTRFESTGIKKIFDIYDALCFVDKGGIAFIDEFDANIHDVLLVKLIQYIKEYAKGQFVFTTHNVSPMDVLQGNKHSIDFLSTDSVIVPWTQNGNNKAKSLYEQGLIDHSPFNIEPFSFFGKFGDDSL